MPRMRRASQQLRNRTRSAPRDFTTCRSRFIFFFVQKELAARRCGHIDFPPIWTDLLKKVLRCPEFIRATPWPLDNDLNRGCASDRSHGVVTYYSDNLAGSDFFPGADMDINVVTNFHFRCTPFSSKMT